MLQSSIIHYILYMHSWLHALHTITGFYICMQNTMHAYFYFTYCILNTMHYILAYYALHSLSHICILIYALICILHSLYLGLQKGWKFPINFGNIPEFLKLSGFFWNLPWIFGKLFQKFTIFSTPFATLHVLHIVNYAYTLSITNTSRI